MEQTLGKRIMHHRKALGLTQDQLAEQLGVTAQAVSKWENDQSCPDITMLPKLAAIFGITTDTLLGSAPAEPVHQAEVVEEDEEKEPNGIHMQKGNFEFSFDAGRFGALAFAMLVLAVGGQLLLGKILSRDLSFWSVLWPTTLLIFGLFGLFKNFSFSHLGCFLFGTYFLLEKWELIPIKLGGELVFPAILVILGLSLLVDALKKPRKPVFRVHSRNGSKKNNYHIEGECFEYAASFGEEIQRVTMPRLSHGKISTSFGDYTVDLSGVQALAADCRLDVTCSFGDLDLHVPRCYRLDPVTSTSFASIHIDGDPAPSPTGVIHLKANANFGEITVRYI